MVLLLIRLQELKVHIEADKEIVGSRLGTDIGIYLYLCIWTVIIFVSLSLGVEDELNTEEDRIKRYVSGSRVEDTGF